MAHLGIYHGRKKVPFCAIAALRQFLAPQWSSGLYPVRIFAGNVRRFVTVADPVSRASQGDSEVHNESERRHRRALDWFSKEQDGLGNASSWLDPCITLDQGYSRSVDVRLATTVWPPMK